MWILKGAPMNWEHIPNRSRNTNGIQLGNNPCDIKIVGGFLQCWTLDVRSQGTSFYMQFSTLSVDKHAKVIDMIVPMWIPF